MNKKKTLIVLSVVVVIEIIAIITLSIMINNSVSSISPTKEEPELTGCYSDEEDDEEGEVEEKKDEDGEKETCYRDETEYFSSFPVAENLFGETFRETYTSILKGETISIEAFYSFVQLSEMFTNYHLGGIITRENSPTKYYVSTSVFDTEKFAYPYNLLRNISLEIPEVGCAVFGFSADFSLLQKYDLYSKGCEENV